MCVQNCNACIDVLILFIFQRGVFVAGLKEEIVNNAEQVLNLIKAGEGLFHIHNYLFLL